MIHEVEWAGLPSGEGSRWIIEASDVIFRWTPHSVSPAHWVRECWVPHARHAKKHQGCPALVCEGGSWSDLVVRGGCRAVEAQIDSTYFPNLWMLKETGRPTTTMWTARPRSTSLSSYGPREWSAESGRTT
jgi:hypothetical protein